MYIQAVSLFFQYVFDPGMYQARLNVLASVCVCMFVQPPSVANTDRLTSAYFGCFHCPGVSIIKRRRMYAVEDEREVVMFVIRHPDVAPTPHGPQSRAHDAIAARDNTGWGCYLTARQRSSSPCLLPQLLGCGCGCCRHGHSSCARPPAPCRWGNLDCHRFACHCRHRGPWSARLTRK